MAFAVSNREALMLFLYALIMGVSFGVLYDIFRISRVMLTGVGLSGSKESPGRIDMLTKRIRENADVRKSSAARLKNRLTNVIIFIEDLLFFVILAFVFTIFLYQANFGQPRLYIYIASVAGFVLYYNTIGRIVAAMSRIVVSLIRLIVTYTVYKIIKPAIKAIAGAISVPVEKLKLRSIIATGERETARLFMMSAKGFGMQNKVKNKDLKRRSRHEAVNEEAKRSG